MRMQLIGSFLARHILLASLVLSMAGGFAQDIKPITLHYYERKPFQYTTEDGHAAGLVVDPVMKVFHKASIPIAWALTPTNRIFAQLKANTGADCSSGWYKSPERESYGKFTAAIYRDKPFTGLIRADSAIPQGIKASELLARPQTNVLFKQGLVYGTYLDGLIAKMAPQQIQTVTAEIPTLVQMIRVNRADMTFMTAEELDYLVAQSGFKMKDFRVLNFPDVPATEMRYIMCSKQVPDDTIRKLNEAIAALIHLN